jgi:plasmid stability protein
MKQITIRNVPDELANALEKEKKRQGKSLNQTAINLLRQSLGVGAGRYNNGLAKLAGTWTRKDLTTFEKDTEIFEHIDDELWK